MQFRRSTILLFWTPAVLAALALPNLATAHVKWFAPYDSSAAPLALQHVLSPAFWLILAALCAIMAIALYVEQTDAGPWAIRKLNNATHGLKPKLDTMMRAGAAVFLVCLWVLGGVILTPELKTESAWVPWMQMAMAVSLFWRRTMVFCGAGIIFLWGYAASKYGLFHLLDYPLFLAVAAYLIITGLPKNRAYPYRFDILRWGAAVTLMWASIEKFAYPEWSFPVLERYPALALGLEHRNFMTLAGLVEFALAFALVCTPVLRRGSALFLAIVFAAAVILFGKIDAIGHMMIIYVLIMIVVDDRSFEIRPRAAFLTPCLIASLASTILLYYGLQASFYGEQPSSSVTASDLDEAPNKKHMVNKSVKLPVGIQVPRVSIAELERTDGEWILHMAVENFSFSQVCTAEVQPTIHGHAHIHINGKKVMTAMTPVVNLGSLTPGVYELRVSLQLPDHRTLVGPDGNPIEAAMSFDAST